MDIAGLTLGTLGCLCVCRYATVALRGMCGNLPYLQSIGLPQRKVKMNLWGIAERIRRSKNGYPV
jgi:hypothetical protein